MIEELKEKLFQKPTKPEEFTDEEDEESSLKKRVWKESKKMWVVAGPAFFTTFSTFGITVITQAFIGHMGSTELAAYALVMTVLVRFANGVLLGMASALEILCGQAYGAKKYEMLGLYLQRSWIVLFLTSIFLLPVFIIITTPILKSLCQEESIAEVAASISLWSIAVVLALIFSLPCQMFLQPESKNTIIAYLAAFSISIHLIRSWLLTVKFKFGLNGAMASAVLPYWVSNAALTPLVGNKVFTAALYLWTHFGLATITLNTDWDNQVEIAQNRITSGLQWSSKNQTTD